MCKSAHIWRRAELGRPKHGNHYTEPRGQARSGLLLIKVRNTIALAEGRSIKFQMSSDWLPVLHSRIDSPLVNSLSLPNSRRSHPNSPRHTRVASIHPRAGCRTTPQVPGANCRSIAPACALPAQAPAAVLSRRVGGLWPPPRSLCPSLYALPPGGPGRPLGRWPIR